MSALPGNIASGWVGRRLRSFVHAGRGVWLLRNEPNARIHFVATTFALMTGVVARLSPLEWAVVVFAIALVLAAEALNTALERLADAVMPERHPLVGAAKDLGAGAVLLAAIGAAVIGALVLGPHLLQLCGAFLFRT